MTHFLKLNLMSTSSWFNLVDLTIVRAVIFSSESIVQSFMKDFQRQIMSETKENDVPSIFRSYDLLFTLLQEIVSCYDHPSLSPKPSSTVLKSLWESLCIVRKLLDTISGGTYSQSNHTQSWTEVTNLPQPSSTTIVHVPTKDYSDFAKIDQRKVTFSILYNSFLAPLGLSDPNCVTWSTPQLPTQKVEKLQGPQIRQLQNTSPHSIQQSQPILQQPLQQLSQQPFQQISQQFFHQPHQLPFHPVQYLTHKHIVRESHPFQLPTQQLYVPPSQPSLQQKKSNFVQNSTTPVTTKPHVISAPPPPTTTLVKPTRLVVPIVPQPISQSSQLFHLHQSPRLELEPRQPNWYKQYQWQEQVHERLEKLQQEQQNPSYQNKKRDDDHHNCTDSGLKQTNTETKQPQANGENQK
eukprot:TRINITY_DN5155_c1_g1_i12.p1 TRINITY_DN5155_c1_g1~~TRINITY_DN5155_c1_g1_i12.p1  ORF type:complete len:408 (-),score=97.21 TRINITY_DN5155_c1_g1_i12:72-1295(-)